MPVWLGERRSGLFGVLSHPRVQVQDASTADSGWFQHCESTSRTRSDPASNTACSGKLLNRAIQWLGWYGGVSRVSSGTSGYRLQPPIPVTQLCSSTGAVHGRTTSDRASNSARLSVVCHRALVAQWRGGGL